MYQIYRASILFLLVYLSHVSLIYAQFDNKITFNTHLGGGIPLGQKLDADSVPYVFSNFSYVLQAGAGVQYNFNGNFSAGVNAGGFTGIRYTNPVPTPSGKEEIIAEEEKNYVSSYFTNYHIGAMVKYKFLKNYKINPYLFIEATLNNYFGEIAPRLEYYKAPTLDDTPAPESITDNYTILRYNAKQISPTFALGMNSGAGIDIKLSDKFTLMLQSTYQWIATSQHKNLRKNVHFIGLQAGLRFSFIQSKSIL